ncbi:hypothetical protein [Streptomyces sp. L2]|uniref:hypothetical protein n=1 Tax=Streptomyces sp. L2 TaxID=2162665 RepID=UPI001012CAF4|nr:hypothetical protein [Streptomyces sp. L2]
MAAQEMTGAGAACAMITVWTTEIKAEQRQYALRMVQKCLQTLQEQDDMDRRLLQDAANWAMIAEALRRRS